MTFFHIKHIAGESFPRVWTYLTCVLYSVHRSVSLKSFQRKHTFVGADQDLICTRRHSSTMCKEASLGRSHIQPLAPAQIPLNGDPNNSLLVSEVAERLAEIGDKVELSYQQRRRQEDEAGLAMRAVYIALFIAFRVLI